MKKFLMMAAMVVVSIGGFATSNSIKKATPKSNDSQTATEQTSKTRSTAKKMVRSSYNIFCADGSVWKLTCDCSIEQVMQITAIICD